MNVNTIKIGNQEWMIDCLTVDTFRNGDKIKEVTDKKEWSETDITETSAWCYYEDNNIYEKPYGKLYNWYAVNDIRGLAPEGFHIPTEQEMLQLIDFLGGIEIAGKFLKSQDSWFQAVESTNSSKFTALPGGWKNANGSCGLLGHFGFFWTATESNSSYAHNIRIHHYDDTIYQMTNYKNCGFSVRCLRN